jgi:hypothetical protein
MPYNPFVATNPAISQTRQNIVDTSRVNLVALRDGVIIGRINGWTLSVSGGTAEEPSIRLWSNGTERLRGTYTYSAGFVTQVVWEYSSNSGSSYDAIATETCTYDGSNNATGGNNSGVLSWLWEWIGKLKSLRTSYNAHAAATGTAVHGLGTMSTQSAASVAITGGNIDNTTIGGTTRAIGTFKQAREVHVAVSFSGGATIDWSAGGSHDFTASGSGAATLTFSNMPPSGIAASIILDVTNGGLRTWTYPSGTKWANGTAPTLTSSGRDILQFYTRDGGTTIHGFMASKDSR